MTHDDQVWFYYILGCMMYWASVRIDLMQVPFAMAVGYEECRNYDEAGDP